MLKLLNTLTDASLEVEVGCCEDGELVLRTCGDGQSCDKICGKTNEGEQLLWVASSLQQIFSVSALLDIDEDDSSICDARYTSVPIYRLGYCVRRVTTLQALDNYRLCCLHPYGK